MRLITWNCQGAFRKKADAVLKYQPDILLVQECEHPDNLISNAHLSQATSMLWFGENRHKGLCVFSFNSYRLHVLDVYKEDFKIISPVAITGDELTLTLIAIWANNRNDIDGRYVEQIWKAINHYDDILNSNGIILAGDFNSNTIWDGEHKKGSHSSVVKKLLAKNIHSIYHKHLKQQQGNEEHPTFFLHRNRNKPYHLDYCFASADLYDKMESFEIGLYEQWATYSDHVPLTVNFHL